MKMICTLIVILLTLHSMRTTNAQSGIDGASAQAIPVQEHEAQQLRLAMNVVDQTYCAGDADLDTLKLNVRFTFTNISNRQLILYKSADLISQIMVSETLADIEAGRFQVNSSVTQLIAGAEKCFAGSAPSRCFVVLPPGASYEEQTTVRVFVVRDETREITGAVASGEHFLKVRVSTWPGSEALSKKLRRRWRHVGCLWYAPITSTPMPFRVEKHRKVVDCS
jgi:hypothetical protein